ncbi:hypothetical protein CFOL_v3_10665 [Cephalotus follicularis]|uniref:Uncharacterized protein n=1 Tax=Cephalotus follicularis TaxID=3775 RepID=A0A1Q3BGK7_CEPFO|nr:hypothetical protein CFOL_v3_10665 [Cephalotus follicularis]
MEGLIPMFCKAIKKNKTRRQYECLSAGAAQSYNMDDLYINGSDQSEGHAAHDKYKIAYMTPQTDKYSDHHHRRRKSVGDLSGGYPSEYGWATGTNSSPTPKKLVRFRSHKMFSCVTGF